MGFFLSSLKEQLPTLPAKTTDWAEHLQQVRQYHGIFKSTSQTLVISKEDFTHIFGETQRRWLWEKKETINAIQLFTGMGFYSQHASFKQKLKFMFSLYDLNEIKTISIVELQYMLLSVCNFTFRLLAKQNTRADQLKLAQWLVKYLDPKERINVTKLYRLCLRAKEIRELLRVVGVAEEELSGAGDQKLRERWEEEGEEREETQRRKEEEVATKLAWFRSFCQKLIKPKYKKQQVSTSRLSWIYGIQLRVSNPFKLLSRSQVIYVVSSRIVVYDFQQNKQRIYSQHLRQVECFAIREDESTMIASAEGKQDSKIYIWNHTTMQTKQIVKVDHSHRIGLLCYSPGLELLAAVGERSHSPVLLFETNNYTVKASFASEIDQPIQRILPFESPLHPADLPQEYQEHLVLVGKKKVVVVDQRCSQLTISYPNDLNSVATAYISAQHPYLRSLCASSLRLFVVSGQSCGSIKATQVVLPLEMQEPDKQELMKLSQAPRQLLITEQSFFILLSSQIRIYELSIFAPATSQQSATMRLIKLSDITLPLLSQELLYADICDGQICMVTTEGDFLVYKDRDIVYNDTYSEQENFMRVHTITRLNGQLKAMCFAERVGRGVMLVVSEQRKLFQIDLETHEVNLVMEVGIEDVVRVVDSASSEEGTGFTICGCRSGKLLVRGDWEEMARAYDCGAEVTDLKISNDAAYLLVSTHTMLLFFQLAPSFSAPRRVTFQNQSPICLNFLDNLRFCSVGTSAKNVYLLELPQLRHRNVQKDNQNFSVTKMAVEFPTHFGDGKVLYSKCVVGGDMSFYLVALTTGQILFFPSMSSLNRGEYHIAQAHRCPIANIAVAQDQKKYYTLGASDGMLLEWSVDLQQPPFSRPSSKPIHNQGIPQCFHRMKMVSEITRQEEPCNKLYTFFFRGTREEKLNASLKRNLDLKSEEWHLGQVSLSKRVPNLTLSTKGVYGMEIDKPNQVLYISSHSSDSRFTFYSSRYMVECSGEGLVQKIHQTSSKRIIYFGLTDLGEPIWAQHAVNPRIFLNNVPIVQTTHRRGMIHFSLKNDLVLSYGIANDGFSLNLHNIRTGQLLGQILTSLQTPSLLLISQREWISLGNVRKWVCFVPSQPLGNANVGVLLPNGRDVLLGGLNGEFSILSPNGIFDVAVNAHFKQVIALRLSPKAGSFQIVSAALDDTLKVWNQYFELVMSMNLAELGDFALLKQSEGHGLTQSQVKPQKMRVVSLDCKAGKVLVTLSIGQVWEFTIDSKIEKIVPNQQIQSKSSLHSDSEQEVSHGMQQQLRYEVDVRKLIDIHCSGSILADRYVAFDLHSELPLLASAGNDGRLIFRDFVRDVVVGNYLCERKYGLRVTNLKFSPQGMMLLVGFSSGVIYSFSVDAKVSHKQAIQAIRLKYFQSFLISQLASPQILYIEFSEQSEYFAVSYIQTTIFQTRKQGSGQLQDCPSFIRVYQKKSQLNHKPMQAFYQVKDTIVMKEEKGKIITGVVYIYFKKEGVNTYLLLCQERLDERGRRMFAQESYSVYCLEDRRFVIDPFAIDCTRATFPALAHLLLQDPSLQDIKQNYALTAMTRHQNALIYGAAEGYLHLVRLASLESQNSREKDPKEMCLSSVYAALTSPLIGLKTSQIGHHTYLFVSSQKDQCVVKFELVREEAELCNQHQAYSMDAQQALAGENIPKKDFYYLINNRQPLRQQLSNILQDVEIASSPQIELKIMRVFGRRASDRRYNLTYFEASVLYCVGPNMVVQGIRDGAQELMKADPSPFSHCPQISSFDCRDRLLLVATEQQKSNIFVWDVKSQSCLSAMKIDCAFVSMIRFMGASMAAYYGINDHYQLVVGLIDWVLKETLGVIRFPFSGNWAIRDITPIESADLPQFATCGYLHLCLWQLKGGILNRRQFNSDPDGRYLCLRELDGYIVTGSEEGHLSLWHKEEMVSQLRHAHSAAVCCIEVNKPAETIISGGKQGVILLLKIQEEGLITYARVGLGYPEQPSILEQPSNREVTYPIQRQIQSISHSNTQNNQVQSILIGTRSGSIYQAELLQQAGQAKLLYQHHDFQSIVSVTFSAWDRQHFYTLTNAGVIEKWSISGEGKLLSVEVGQKAIKVQSCGKHLLVCCLTSVLAFKIDLQNNSLIRDESLKIDTARQEREGTSEITTFCLSMGGRNAALCLRVGLKEPTYVINLYQIGRGDYLFQLGNLKHQIDYVDFSTDDKYLLFKDRYEQIGMLSLQKGYRRINTIFVQMSIEWQREGLRLSPGAQSIYYSYSCENKITSIVRLGRDKIVVGDEMGTVRIFDYPCPQDRLGQLHLQCYSTHMNDITNISVHPNGQYLITTSLQDRAMVLWQVDTTN